MSKKSLLKSFSINRRSSAEPNRGDSHGGPSTGRSFNPWGGVGSSSIRQRGMKALPAPEASAQPRTQPQIPSVKSETQSYLNSEVLEAHLEATPSLTPVKEENDGSRSRKFLSRSQTSTFFQKARTLIVDARNPAEGSDSPSAQETPSPLAIASSAVSPSVASTQLEFGSSKSADEKSFSFTGASSPADESRQTCPLCEEAESRFSKAEEARSEAEKALKSFRVEMRHKCEELEEDMLRQKALHGNEARVLAAKRDDALVEVGRLQVENRELRGELVVAKVIINDLEAQSKAEREDLKKIIERLETEKASGQKDEAELKKETEELKEDRNKLREDNSRLKRQAEEQVKALWKAEMGRLENELDGVPQGIPSCIEDARQVSAAADPEAELQELQELQRTNAVLEAELEKERLNSRAQLDYLLVEKEALEEKLACCMKGWDSGDSVLELKVTAEDEENKHQQQKQQWQLVQTVLWGGRSGKEEGADIRDLE